MNGSNIIQLNVPPKPKTPSFTISAHWKDDTWFINVEDFYNRSVPTHEMFREIAEALAPITKALIQTAEEIEPTKRGPLIANILMYRDGTIIQHSTPFNTAKRRSWFLAALERVKESASPKKRSRSLDKSPR